VALVAGVVVVFSGVLMMFLITTAYVCNAITCIYGLVSGSFLCMLGTIIICISLDVGDDAYKTLERLWERFLEALGR